MSSWIYPGNPIGLQRPANPQPVGVAPPAIRPGQSIPGGYVADPLGGPQNDLSRHYGELSRQALAQRPQQAPASSPYEQTASTYGQSAPAGIGVARQGKAGPSVGVSARPDPSLVPFAPATAEHGQDALARNMSQYYGGQIRQAYGQGDIPKATRLAAEHQAFADGGYIGLLKHQNGMAMDDATLARAGAGPGGGIPKTRDGLLDVNAARTLGMRETNSASGGDEFANNASVQNYQTLAGQGKPYQIDPAHIPAIIDSRAPHLKRFFEADQNGPRSSVPEILGGVNAADPRIFQNPNGLESQAVLGMIRQLHGDGVAAQLDMPADPQSYMAPRFKSTGYGWLDNQIDRIPRAGALFGSALDNLLHWRSGVINPESAYDGQRQANDLYSALTNPNHK